MDVKLYFVTINIYATVVELVDTRDSKSLFRKKVSVRVRSVVFKKMFEYIEKSLKKRGIELDSSQSDLIHKMIESIQPDKDLANKLENKDSKKGFYIWGDLMEIKCGE